MPLSFSAAGGIFWSWWLISYGLGRGIVVAFADEDYEGARIEDITRVKPGWRWKQSLLEAAYQDFLPYLCSR